MKALTTDVNPTVARTRLLTGISRLELFTGHYDSARAHLEESVRILREREESAGLAEALGLSAAIRNMGYSDLAGALQLADEGVQVARRTGDDRTLGMALNHLGSMLA